ncbi:MAG: Nif3-like dinuclear metal center hexameric protein [Labilithrix sp.]|nr:Nif3-like dinuclear metal center hexameric protein [Labilithrix sp.]MCW5813473.1 Nif3-like dinuclear metal center hexameric protein [Labilithrix sp.]
MKLDALLKVLDELAPLRYAEGWDNVGLLVGDPDADVTRVLVTVDYSKEVAEEARAKGVQLVVAYHPPMFAAVKRAPHAALWVDAVRRGIALYSMHTALDVAAQGTNEFLARVAGVDLASMKPLRPFVGKPGRPEPEGIGLGRVGDVAPAPLGDLVARLKTALTLERVLVAGSLDRVVRRVAVAAGAGGELLGDAIRERADVFVTGELRHHDAMRGCSVVATLHSNSERAAVKELAGRIAAALAGVEVTFSERDADPFAFV